MTKDNLKEFFEIETIISFPTSIQVEKEVLGKVFEIHIGKVSGIIAFPSLNFNFKENFMQFPCEYLNCPEGTFKVNSINNEKCWGKVNVSNGNSSIYSCCLRFKTEKSNCAELSNSLKKLTYKYIDLFCSYIEVFSKQSIYAVNYLSINNINCSQFFGKRNDGSFFVAGEQRIEVFIQMPVSSLISVNIIKKAILKANTGKELEFSFKILRDAFYHYDLKDYRRAIIDTCTAVEICLTNVLLDQKENHGLQEKLKKEIDYLTLRKLKKLFNEHKIELPNSRNLIESIGEKRNKAVHSGKTPTETETKNAILIANQILLHFFKI